MKRHLITLLFLFAVTHCHSQKPSPSDGIDSIVRLHMSDRHIPGLALAILKNGQVIKKESYGLSNVETQSPVSANSVFEIASMTKQFTCAAILLLEQEGKLSVTDRLSKYLDDLPPSWEEITLSHLMNHTSGLRDDWNEPTSYFYNNNTVQKMSLAQMEYPLYFEPGEGFNYSSGPFFLGLVIEKVSGLDYGAFLNDRIFSPLNMLSTSVYEYRDVIPERVSGYRWNKGLLENGVDLPPSAESRADVGVISSLNDMIKWDLALKNDSLLEEGSLEQMFSAGSLNGGKSIPYGYGWYLYMFRNELVIEHGGAFRTGFGSRITLFPRFDMDIIILCNLWQPGLSDLSTQIASYYVQDFKQISELIPQTHPKTQVDRGLEELFTGAANNKFSRGELYQLTNFSGFDPDELADILEGFQGIEFMNKSDLKMNPIELYGSKIETIHYYKIIANEVSYWSCAFSDSMELVSVSLED